MKSRLVELSGEALLDLQRIYDRVAEDSSHVTARRYTDRITDFCERLDLASERGTLRNEVRPGLRTIGFEKRVTVAFVVEPESVVILRIFHGGVDWEREL